VRERGKASVGERERGRRGGRRGRERGRRERRQAGSGREREEEERERGMHAVVGVHVALSHRQWIRRLLLFVKMS
jgi:hypothetical protein